MRPGERSRDGVKDGEGTETRGTRHSNYEKFGLRRWSWRQRLLENGEVAAPRDWGWVGWGTTLEPRSGLEPRPNLTQVLPASRAPAAAVPASRRPCVLRAPPPGRPALGSSSAPALPPLGRPRPQPPGVPAAVEGGGCREKAIAPGPQVCVCVRARARGLGLVWSFRSSSRSPRGTVPATAAAGRCGGREGAGLAEAQLREGSGGGGGGRSPLPPPTRRPRAGSDPAQAWYGVVA